MTRLILAFTIALAGAMPAAAQTSDLDRAYARAAGLVRDGQGAEGRRIVDSLFVRAREGTAEHAEALYWRAALASDTHQAERDYRQLVVDYPLSPRAGRALLALAQLELTRGDRERALAHLQRLEREHPSSDVRPTAAFWMARIRFDMGDEPRACTALDVAQRAVAADDVELRNQMDFLATRCVGVSRDTINGVASRASGVGRATGTATPVERSRPTPDPQPRTSFAVQLAAYDTRADAQALVARLARRDVTARVVGSAKPFRVWTGSYATRADANAALRALRERRIDGFVVQQPASP